MSWSVVALHVCWVFESVKPTGTDIAPRSTSLKHVPNMMLQKEVQCKAQSFCPRTLMILLLRLLVKGCVVVCDAEFSTLVSVMCLYSAMPKLVHVFFVADSSRAG